ncbi:hypothetical protein [Granulicella paludicola]|jgi:hypothetical protein|uniref:hypothetical protein n=1 Tax=Granulicella paludicola TaxID=474951 RepID=UPI0021E0DE3B|nr:hypothetical protein [Granulicella paludicola]
MAEQRVVLDIPEMTDASSEALRHATERAEAAEAELAKIKGESSRSEEDFADRDVSADAGGVEELRKDSMMAHLLDSLEAGKDIGHYGRLVFAMVARHFLSHEGVLGYLTRDKDFTEEQAVLMLRQVEGRDYNPPKRERLLEWQSQQDFPILPNPEDPDCGNLYRNLKFPEEVYEHIGQYQEEKLHASS